MDTCSSLLHVCHITASYFLYLMVSVVWKAQQLLHQFYDRNPVTCSVACGLNSTHGSSHGECCLPLAVQTAHGHDRNVADCFRQVPGCARLGITRYPVLTKTVFCFCFRFSSSTSSFFLSPFTVSFIFSSSFHSYFAVVLGNSVTVSVLFCRAFSKMPCMGDRLIAGALDMYNNIKRR